MGGLMEATEYEFRIFAENETGLSRPRRTPMGIKTKLSGEMLQISHPIRQNELFLKKKKSTYLESKCEFEITKKAK